MMFQRYCLLSVLALMSLTACTNDTSSFNEIPLPYHEEFAAVVIEREFQNSKLSKIKLLRIAEEGGGNAREYNISGRAILPFTRYSNKEIGDVFFLRHSIISDRKGQYESEHYNILNVIPRKGQQFNFKGVGEVPFGLSLEKYQGRYSTPYSYAKEAECRYVALYDYPGMLFMINNEKIVRADINDLFFATRNTPFYSLWSGEETFDQWKAANPEIEITQHEYQEGYYLTWYSKKRDAAIVAEYVQGKIKLVRGGMLPHAFYVEGCS